MADQPGEPDSVIGKISEKIDALHSSSSSDSDDDKPSKLDAAKSRVRRLFGREKPVYEVLGGGKRTLSLSISISLYIYISLVLDWFMEKKIEEI